MWCMKHRLGYPDWNGPMKIFRSRLSQKLRDSGYTCGYDKDIYEEMSDKGSIYSKDLCALINECLLINSAERPSAESLVHRTKDGMESSIDITGNIIFAGKDTGEANMQSKGRPSMSTQWYSGIDLTRSQRMGPFPHVPPKPGNETPQAQAHASQASKPTEAARGTNPPSQSTQPSQASPQAFLSAIRKPMFQDPLRQHTVRPVQPEPPKSAPVSRQQHPGFRRTTQNPTPPSMLPTQQPAPLISKTQNPKPSSVLPTQQPAPLVSKPLPPVPLFARPPPQQIRYLRCTIETRRFFGIAGVNTKVLIPSNLNPNLTILQLKRRLATLGADIPALSMRVLVQGTEFANTRLLHELDGQVDIRVVEA